MELYAVVDRGAPFVKPGYFLGTWTEVTASKSSRAILQALAITAQRHYPNVAAQARKLGVTVQEVHTLTAHASNGVEPGINYFLQKLNLQFHNTGCAFKAARFRLPCLDPTPDACHSQHNCRSCGASHSSTTMLCMIANLQDELPAYTWRKQTASRSLTVMVTKHDCRTGQPPRKN